MLPVRHAKAKSFNPDETSQAIATRLSSARLADGLTLSHGNARVDGSSRKSATKDSSGRKTFPRERKGVVARHPYSTLASLGSVPLDSHRLHTPAARSAERRRAENRFSAVIYAPRDEENQSWRSKAEKEMDWQASGNGGANAETKPCARPKTCSADHMTKPGLEW